MFYARRLIIGRLCKNDEEFELLIDKVYAVINRKDVEQNLPLLDRFDINDEYNKNVQYIRNNIKPIY